MASQKLVLSISLLASAVLFAPVILAQGNSTSTQLPSTNSSVTPTPTQPPSNSTLPGNSTSSSVNPTPPQPPSTTSLPESSTGSSVTATPSQPPSTSSPPGNSTESSENPTPSEPASTTLPPLTPPGNSTHPPPPPPPPGNCTCPPPPPPHGNETDPTPEPPHPLHNLTLGNRVEGDKLVLTQNVTVPGRLGVTATSIRTYIANNNNVPLNITLVQVANLDPRPYASIVKQLVGGPGHSNVTLMFKSLKDGIGLSFFVSLFAV